jgi:hypothetical protein
MLKLKIKTRSFVILSIVAAVAGITLYGCTHAPPPAAQDSATDETANPPKFALWGPPPKKSGVQLWSENCARCHNMRPPDSFSDQQWAIIVHHMRLRANLTGEEQREITKFLQASN